MSGLILDPLSVSILILLSTLPLLPVLLLSPMMAIRHRLLWEFVVVLYIAFGITSIGLAINLILFTAYGVGAWIIFFPGWDIISFSIRIGLVNILLPFASMLASILPRRSMLLHLNLVELMRLLASRCSSLLLSLAKTLLSFLLPTNTTSLLYRRLVLGIVLASILVACSSCRSRYRYTLVMVFLYWLVAVDIQEGFSFSVGPGTKRTLYRFCDHHFFRVKPLLLCYSVRPLCLYRLCYWHY